MLVLVTLLFISSLKKSVDGSDDKTDIPINEETKAIENERLYREAEQKHRRAGAVCCVLALIGFALMLVTTLVESAPQWLTFVGIGIAVPSLFAVVYLGQEDAAPKPTPGATYHMALQNKKFLGVEIKPVEGTWTQNEWVYLVAENSAGEVEYAPICPAKYQESTKVQEPTFDVHKGVVFVPYKKEREA